jgi:hypothetical protein
LPGVPVELSSTGSAVLVRKIAARLSRARGVGGGLHRTAGAREKHRLIHGSDWQRWGRRGGLATLRRYGTSWYSALALKRWGRLEAEDLARARVIGQGLPIKDDVA